MSLMKIRSIDRYDDKIHEPHIPNKAAIDMLFPSRVKFIENAENSFQDRIIFRIVRSKRIHPHNGQYNTRHIVSIALATVPCHHHG